MTTATPSSLRKALTFRRSSRRFRQSPRLEDELPLLIHDPGDVRVWFEREIERYKQQGMVAE